jgi:hypothetical protein
MIRDELMCAVTTGPSSQVWWYTPVIPAFRRLTQEDRKFHASLGHKCDPVSKKKKKKPKPTNTPKNNKKRTGPAALVTVLISILQ